MKKTKEIYIEDFNKKGLGVSFDDYKNKIEIPNALIDDLVVAELNKKRKGIIKGNILEIKKQSKYRQESKCSHHEFCGGCIWQALLYKEQIRQKEKFVIRCFEKYITTTNLSLFPIIESEPYEYRNKMEFSFSQNMKRTKYLGLMMKGRRRFVFNIERCHLAKKWFSDVLNETRSWWEDSELEAYNSNNNTGLLRNLTIRYGINTHEKMVVLTASSMMDQNDIDSFVTSVKKVISDHENLSIFLRLHISQKGTPTVFKDVLLFNKDHIKEKIILNDKELIFKISPSSFFQPNTIQAQKIYQQALDLADINEESIVYDLYSGTGTLGMIFASIAKEVIGIEINQDAVNNANANISLNKIDNFHIYQGDVAKVLQENHFKKPDLIIVDPPRAGLDQKALDQIIHLNPKTIIYISCNPLTQRENIDFLTNKNYTLQVLQPIDQFAHTYHIENIAMMKRS